MRDEIMYKELLELIQTDSASGKEQGIAEKLKLKLKELGFTVSQDKAGETFGGSCGNVLGIREGELDKTLLLCSHMDRVPNGLGIKPVEKDGILYSDGTTILAADDIAGVAVILAGLRRLLAEKCPLPRLEVLFTVGEESGLNGAKAMDVAKLQAKTAYIFDSPGPVGRFVNAAPGHYNYKVEIKGRSAHAGNEPEKGIDAAKTLCDILAALPQGRLDEVSTANFPIIRTGSTARNVVCDYAYFEGESRSRDEKKLVAYAEEFEVLCRKIAAEHGAEIDIEMDKEHLPFYVPPTEPILMLAQQTCAQLGLDCRIEAGGGGMDANIFAQKGITCVGVAVGYTKNHTSKEQLVLEDFFKAGELAAALVKNFAKSC